MLITPFVRIPLLLVVPPTIASITIPCVRPSTVGLVIESPVRIVLLLPLITIVAICVVPAPIIVHGQLAVVVRSSSSIVLLLPLVSCTVGPTLLF